MQRTFEREKTFNEKSSNYKEVKSQTSVYMRTYSSHTARHVKQPSQWLNKALLPSTSIAFSHKLCVCINTPNKRERERERFKHKIARRVAMILTQF